MISIKLNYKHRQVLDTSLSCHVIIIRETSNLTIYIFCSPVNCKRKKNENYLNFISISTYLHTAIHIYRFFFHYHRIQIYNHNKNFKHIRVVSDMCVSLCAFVADVLRVIPFKFFLKNEVWGSMREWKKSKQFNIFVCLCLLQVDERDDERLRYCSYRGCTNITFDITFLEKKYV